MDPPFRRNYQLHMLLKKRTHISDNELYEMMRSRNVYRAQNDLRRELDRRLQAIKQDQKVKIASFMVQRATFVKMVAARQKSLGHLLNVKRELEGVFFEDETLGDTEENELDFSIEQEPYIGIYEEDGVIHDLIDKRYDQRENQERCVVQTVNKEWMDNITKGESSGKENPSIHVDDFDPNRKERVLRERILKEHTERDPKFHDMESEMICSTKRKSRKNLPKMAMPEEVSNSLPKIQTTKDKQPKENFPTNPQNNRSSYENFTLLHPNNSHTSLPKSDPPTHLTLPPKVPERERTVSMLFVEDSDDDDDRQHLVSPFDIDAYIKQNRQKRGYTIIISSNDLHQSKDNEQNENTNPKEIKTKKTIHSKRRLPICTSWGVKGPDGINTRERSKQWYEQFLATRNVRKHHRKPTQLPSENAIVYHKGEKRELWNTPSSSDSQISTTLYELKLQRLKEHCRELSDRVAQFVSS